MPLAVFVLGLSIFAQGTSELMLAGLLPEVAADLGVSIPDAGLLISAFAMGMLVGAPVLAMVTLRWPRRTALLTFLAIFVATHVAGALTSNYATLFVTRVVGAFVYAGFWAVATVTAVGLVPPTARGRAMGIVAGGLTVATVIGLPAGTVIGQHLGWRAAFWTVAVMSALAMIGVLATIPGGRPEATTSLRAEVRTLANPRLWLAYGTTSLATSGLLVTFSYLAPFLTETTGLSSGWVPAVLVLYGVGAFTGISVGARNADARPHGTLAVGVVGLVVISVALALAAHQPVLTVVLVCLLGAFGFATNPVLNTRVFSLTSGANTLAASMNTSAFNVGITAGPWLGGLAIDADLGYPSVAWIGAALGMVSLVAVVIAARLDRRHSRARDTAVTAEAHEPAGAPA
ncbi:MFS transporter, DHA1 family, chloramphenicol resistance protein [Streptoalloteichus tenebrarius]|uniref:MFS transporter, DHA1 family, chloramphenicol resistance protein n=1 Tax=Streptoalloteichus tenebrarius (strain ATCC 17920 / DSM 40477 / JCM 4838 / CBS 697.72 / NBRC 16177 / NCIMB 11028 / NRRL B-12390 / A12253. 1 / ISP 5477) TaxID=1933 RepID=A0ABT1HQ02_STRSD|nr:Cmx/CmrA family chloramphenicol efflux MFS transporter [Streptoalloteichus tenebrarius]MCP2257595.1 MFS transporter, DHA1 family, chloramphenicol resistance protein [Streptoalloteichus tenebrarius]BFE98551.1 MFS transporter [Streptoalloteichus tenebrarius]